MEDIKLGTTIPHWINEEEWENNALDGDIMQNIHLNNTLKPSIKEWKEYFKWLEQIVGYPSNEVALIKKQRARHRRISARLCMFLHFHRLGIPLHLIKSGEFGTPAFWRKAKRKPWRKASFVYIPRVNKKIDWWCSPDPEPSLSGASTVKVCHKFQTSPTGEDEEVIRTAILTKYKDFISSVDSLNERAKQLTDDLEEYKTKYEDEKYKSLINEEKQKELIEKENELKESLKVVADEESLKNAEKNYDSIFACSLLCYQQAHVAFAAEKSRLEEEEKERKRLEEEERIREENKRKEEERIAKELEEQNNKLLAAKEGKKDEKVEIENEGNFSESKAEEAIENKEIIENDNEKEKENETEDIIIEENSNSLNETNNEEEEEKKEENEKEVEEKVPATEEDAEKDINTNVPEIQKEEKIEKVKKPKIKRYNLVWGGEFPFWLDEEKWNESTILEPNIIEKVHEADVLKPSRIEWEAYFNWLERYVKYNEKDLKMLRSQKMWQRSFTPRLCLFLHFHRLGIPSSHIIKGKFGTTTGWKDANRNVWAKAFFINVPFFENSIDWWCSNEMPLVDVTDYSTVKICHIFQTSDCAIDEFEDRKYLAPVLIALGAKIHETKENSIRLLEEIGVYKERYNTPQYTKLINKQKLTELESLCSVLERLLPIVDDKISLKQMEKAHDSAFACSLLCYQNAHVAFAAEKSRLEEAEREKQRLEKERQEKEEQDRIEREKKEKEEQERKEREEQEAIKREEEKEKSKKEKAEKELLAKQEKERLMEERKNKAKLLYENREKDIKNTEEKEDITETKNEEIDDEEMSEFDEERKNMKNFVNKPPVSTGELIYDVFDSLERFTAERIVLIGKQLEMSDEEIVNMLQVNQKIADSNRRRIKRANRKKVKVEKSLTLSGLL